MRGIGRRRLTLFGWLGLIACGCGHGCVEGRIGDVPERDASPASPAPAAPNGPTAPTAPGAPSGRYFPATSVWTRDVSAASVDAESKSVIAGLEAMGGWGGGRLQIDFSLEVLTADEKSPMRTFTPSSDFYRPDCEEMPVPLPPGGALEGEAGYGCTGDGDCHLIVHHVPTKKLYEMWRANVSGSTFRGGCLAVWDLTRVYPASGRGKGCTSADAAGYPIAPLLFSADEVAAGEIAHAVRFILPNARIRSGVYVFPATHTTSAAKAGTDAPPYGARFRLRADYPISSLPSEGARTVARALQRYGMLLADGGTIALTAQSDRFTKAKWDGLLGARDLQALKVSDFEMIDGGPRVASGSGCTRD